MQTTHYLWHWKQFDLDAPRYDMGTEPGKAIEFKGLITSDSVATDVEQQRCFLGVERVGAHRHHFYRDCLTNLKGQYQKAGIKLIESSQSLQDFLTGQQDGKSEIVVWHYPHFSAEEREFLDGLKLHFTHTVEFRKLRANTLIGEDELPFELTAVPETFSRFRKKIEKKPYPSYFFAGYRLPEQDQSPGRMRIKEYIFTREHILNYKKTRNGLGEGDYSSRLSKWLATGCIQAAEVGFAILQFERQRRKNESTYWLLFELLWRDYFHFLHRKIDNRFFAPDGMKRRTSPGLIDKVPWSFHHSNAPMRYSRDHSSTILTLWQRFRGWALGKTGQEFVDTMMKELYFTGELSNRGRQCAASYLIHDLHIPWWWGAQWFEHLLVDYDVSSNWGNWAYIAGVGADPREVRRFNMTKQAKMYDPDGRYRRWGKDMQWHVPEEAIPVEFPGEFG